MLLCKESWMARCAGIQWLAVSKSLTPSNVEQFFRTWLQIGKKSNQNHKTCPSSLFEQGSHGFGIPFCIPSKLYWYWVSSTLPGYTAYIPVAQTEGCIWVGKRSRDNLAGLVETSKLTSWFGWWFQHVSTCFNHFFLFHHVSSRQRDEFRNEIGFIWSTSFELSSLSCRLQPYSFFVSSSKACL